MIRIFKSLRSYFTIFRLGIYTLLLQFNAMLNQDRIHIYKGVRAYVPIRCDGEGKVAIGANTSLGYPFAIKIGNGEILLQARTQEANILIGKGCSFSNNISIISNNSITIGHDCLIGDMVVIVDSDFHEISPIKRKESQGISKSVVIGNNVWLGSRVYVQKGVVIGDNSIITPMAVVTNDIPSNCIAGGIPAKIIRQIG